MDLLQDIETGAPPEDTEGAAPPDLAGNSLVGRAERIFYHGRAPQSPAPPEARMYPDGYVRRSPPQPYRTPKGYYRRIALRTALYATAAILLLILLAALMKRRILRF